MKFHLVLLISVSVLLGCTDGGDENHLPTVSDNNKSTCGELLELASQYETLETKGFNEPGIQIISATLMDEWREVANC
ncbi:hypothetical protein ACET9H_21560 [Aeromonas media]|uniref:hypothetical protein n=1 Tax=Aeromonas media TaxID=651 RepID=UPI0038D22D6A